MFKICRLAVAAAFVGAVVAPLPAMAEGPAVSGINGKMSVQGGDMNGRSASSADAVISAPLGQSFGVQLDGAVGNFLSSNYRGYGGHLFWRDPSRGLFGAIAAHQKYGDFAVNRSGVESEIYLDVFSLGARGGYQSGGAGHGGYFGIGGRWYITDNVALNLGYNNSPGRTHTNGIGLEWQPTDWGPRGLSLFVRGEESTSGNHAATVGVRFYFGESKSLKQRHRTDDPESVAMPLGDGVPTPSIHRTPTAAPRQISCPQFYSLVDGVCRADAS